MSVELMNQASAVPREVRESLVETVEDIGQAMGLLREATGDAEAGNVIGAKMSGSDALFILSELEGKFSAMVAKLGRWSEGCEDDEEAAGECASCGERLETVRPGKHQCPACG